MLIEEYPYNGRTDRIKHYSDEGFTIIQNETGVEYGEAIDIYPCRFTYSETDHPIEPEPEEEATEQDYIESLERLGVEI